jgi:hypothetical protein
MWKWSGTGPVVISKCTATVMCVDLTLLIILCQSVFYCSFYYSITAVLVIYLLVTSELPTQHRLLHHILFFNYLSSLLYFFCLYFKVACFWKYLLLLQWWWKKGVYKFWHHSTLIYSSFSDTTDYTERWIFMLYAPFHFSVSVRHFGTLSRYRLYNSTEFSVSGSASWTSVPLETPSALSPSSPEIRFSSFQTLSTILLVCSLSKAVQF